MDRERHSIGLGTPRERLQIPRRGPRGKRIVAVPKLSDGCSQKATWIVAWDLSSVATTGTTPLYNTRHGRERKVVVDQ